MHLSLRQLEVFRLLMRVRNVTQTARVLNISQPAVSATIKELEGQLGLPLFVRGNGRIAPTGEANLLLPEIERLFLQLDKIHSSAREFVDAQAGSLRIAAIPTLMAELLPRAVVRLRAERPRVRITMVGHPTLELAARIMQETVDIGFAFLPIHETGVAIEPIFETELVCLMHSDHRLVNEPAIDMSMVADEPFISQSAYTPPGFAVRTSVSEDVLSRDGMIDTNLSVAFASLVRETHGIGIMDPLVLCSPLGRDLVARSYAPQTKMTLAAIYSRHRPVARAAVRFVAAVRYGLHAVTNELAGRGIWGRTL